jgi:DNA invertase Pin-like site-specific DNA recombinase
LLYTRHVTDAIGYVRVSTEEQADSQLGLAAQRAAIIAEAERRGWHLVEIVEDAGVSGKSLNRPGMIMVLAALRERRADTLVVAKLDRLGRSLLDLAGLIERAGKEGWGLVALDIGVDTASLSGKAMAGMMAVFSELERGMIGLRTREALRAARERGTVVGRRSTLPTDVVERIRAEYRSGASLSDVAAALTRDGVPTGQGGRRWYPSTVASVLRRIGEPTRPRGRQPRGSPT